MAAMEAIFAALEMARNPGLVHVARSAPLPGGIDTLLKIAIGDATAIAMVQRATGRSERSLREAAGFFVEQILLDPDADSYRCLGADEKASAAELRHNMALLTRWLHPDVTGTQAGGFDRSRFAPRVTQAWENLKNDNRRAQYDLRRARGAQTTAAGERSTKRHQSTAGHHGAAGHAGVEPATGTKAAARGEKSKRQRRRIGMFRIEKEGLLSRLLGVLRGQ